MLQSFSLAFTLVGLPILFILREYMPIDKKLFTYSFMALNLILLINFKNLISFSYYFNINLIIRIFIITLLSLFNVISLYNYGLNDQSMYLIITLYIFIALFTIKGDELKYFFKYLLLLSTISVYLAFFTTPIDPTYWIDKGGRFYLGDTNNAGVVSVLTVINIICIIFYFLNPNSIMKYKLILLPLLFISPYLYFLSQGKSTIIGIVLVLMYLFLNYISYLKNNNKILFKYLSISLLSIPIFYHFFEEQIKNFSEIIVAAALSLFGFRSTVVQMSAEIRNENFSKTLDYMSIDNFLGYGINTFRMDSPFLQTAVDLGNPLAIIFFVSAIIYPLFLILKTNYKIVDINTKIGILIYIFYFQNFFFHGTPYEYSIWLPFLIFLKLISSKDYRI